MLGIDKREVLVNLPISIPESSRIDRVDGFGFPNYTKRHPSGQLCANPLRYLRPKNKKINNNNNNNNSEIVAKGPNVLVLKKEEKHF